MTHLYDEETCPTTAAGYEHQGTKNPMLTARLGTATLGAVCVSPYDIDNGAFVQSHDHCSGHGDHRSHDLG